MPLKKVIELEIPQDIFIALNETETELKREIKIFIAIKFYQSGKLSIGKSAELAGMTRYEFEKLLSENNIPISNLTVDDIEEDIKKLEDI